MERILLKNNKLRAYFISNPQSSFYETPLFNQILQFVITQAGKHGFSFKKSNKYFYLIKEGVPTLSKAREHLSYLFEGAHEPADNGSAY